MLKPPHYSTLFLLLPIDWGPCLPMFYLCAVEGHTCEHRLRHAGPPQLLPYLLVDVWGHVLGRGVTPGGVVGGPGLGGGGGARDGRVVEELLVEGRVRVWVGVRVGVRQEAAKG